MSLIIKTAATSVAENEVSLPVNCLAVNYSLTTYDVIVSYIQFDEDDTHKKFLTTDAITQLATNTDSNKIMSGAAFSVYKNEIRDIISNSINNQIGYFDFVKITSKPLEDTLYNCFDSISDDYFNSAYLTKEDTLTVDGTALFGTAVGGVDGKEKFLLIAVGNIL